jgi:hypothetical protein
VVMWRRRRRWRGNRVRDDIFTRHLEARVSNLFALKEQREQKSTDGQSSRQSKLVYYTRGRSATTAAEARRRRRCRPAAPRRRLSAGP